MKVMMNAQQGHDDGSSHSHTYTIPGDTTCST